jgi:nucleoside-diphosphate-sugar epimerase
MTLDDSTMTPQNVLVTGGAGYVGSVLVDELLSRGHRVRALDVLLHGSVQSLLLPWGNSRFEFIRGDVRDQDVRTRALTGIDAVVHLAAIVGDPACSRQQDLARDVNLNGTKGMLASAAASGVSRFVFASTCSNYGRVPVRRDEGRRRDGGLERRPRVCGDLPAVRDRLRNFAENAL